MATFLFRLGRWSYLHRKFVLVVWLGVLVVVGGLSTAFQKGYNDLFAIDGVPSQHATEMLMDKFPGTKNPMEDAGVTLVYQAPEGKTLTDPDVAAAVDESIAAVKDNVTAMTDEARDALTGPVAANDAQTDLLIGQETEMGLPKEVAEAAMIAGLPQAPSQYNPFLNPKAALQRRNEVLQAMVQQGYIPQAEYDVRRPRSNATISRSSGPRRRRA